MGAALRRVDRVGLAAALLGANVLLAVALVHGPPAGAWALGILPVALIALAALAASDRRILAFAALGLPLSLPVLNQPLTSGSPQVFTADLIVLLAAVSWAVARLTHSRSGPPSRDFTPLVVGVPLVAFTAAVMWAAERGHASYGTNLLGQPTRLALYAAIGFALCDVSARAMYRGLVVVLYAGIVFNAIDGAWLLATGGSQTAATEALSTGGERVIALSTSLHLAGGLFIALLELESARPGRRWGRGLPLLMASLALLGIVLAFGRATFVAVAICLPVLLALAPRTRRTLLAVAPLALPVIAGVGVAVATLKPSLWHTLVDRLNVTAVASSGGDASADWRRSATHQILEQFHSSPFTGVGFGKGAHFTLNNATFAISQDPHNSYIWLLAAGGVMLLGLFVVLLACFAWDVARRLRGAVTLYERNLLVWCALSMVAFLINLALGPMLSDANELLGFWLVMLLPAVVPLRRGRVDGARSSDPDDN